MVNTLLNVTDIRAHLTTPSLRSLPIDLHVYIDSTNTYLKQLVSSGTSFAESRNSYICLAEQQTHGRGRQTNKTWHSPFAENIYLSIAFPFSRSLQSLEGFSLVTALAVTKALTPFLPHYLAGNLQIKWPNDVYYVPIGFHKANRRVDKGTIVPCPPKQSNGGHATLSPPYGSNGYEGKKLAGILLETITQPHQQNCVVVGIGVNVNMRDIPENMPWTSLALISGNPQDRNVLVAAIIEQFFLYLDLFEQTGFSPFLEEWKLFDYLRGKEVSLQAGKNTYTGIASGINDRGQLLIEANGQISAYASGELRISARP